MLEALKPYGRAVKYAWLKRSAQRQARRPISQAQRKDSCTPCFIIGCGRSGTTVLGQCIGLHPKVFYLNEPYHLWNAATPVTDAIHLFGHPEARLFMDRSHASEEVRVRFERLILHPKGKPPGAMVVEKTPFNAMRLGFLEALAAGARYVHIVRDGVDVCRSIALIASVGGYRIAGMPNLNPWWGNGYCKWHYLARDGAAAGYYPDKVSRLTAEEARAAYEWLVSLGEVDRWRDRLGDRLLEFTYDHLTTLPRQTLQSLGDFLDIGAPQQWIDAATHLLDRPRRNPGLPISLPEAMCRDFNASQQRYGFPGRAIVQSTS